MGDNHAGARRAHTRSEAILTGRPFLQSPFVSKSSERRAWSTAQAPAMGTWPLRNRRSRKTQSSGSTRPLYDNRRGGEHVPLERQILNETARKLVANPTLSIEIERHTDAVRTELYNLGLGRWCAEVVKGYLVLCHRIDPKRMRTFMSYGARSRPPIVAPIRGAQNRRVEFKALIRQSCGGFTSVSLRPEGS
jgi:hypothetical protein